MADEKISQLTEATNLTGVELAGIQAGGNVRVPATLFPSGSGTNNAQYSSAVSCNAMQLAGPSAFIKVTNMTQVEWDPSNFWNETENKFQPTVAGLYLVGGIATIESLTDGRRMVVAIFKNDASYRLLGRGISGGGGANMGFGGSTAISLNGTTDYLDLRVYHANDADTNIVGDIAGGYGGYTNFFASYMGATP